MSSRSSYSNLRLTQVSGMLPSSQIVYVEVDITQPRFLMRPSTRTVCVYKLPLYNRWKFFATGVDTPAALTAYIDSQMAWARKQSQQVTKERAPC